MATMAEEVIEAGDTGNMMLSRRERQTIVIRPTGDPEIVVTICRIKGSVARVSVRAAKTVKILRGEVVARERAALLPLLAPMLPFEEPSPTRPAA